jgi:hypothetical protein
MIDIQQINVLKNSRVLGGTEHVIAQTSMANILLVRTLRMLMELTGTILNNIITL